MTADTANMKQTAGPSFGSDYMGGAHPRVLEALTETNALRTPGYGTDSFCQEAAALIRQACRCPQAEVRFLVGGTQTNLVALSALLAPYQGVVAADTGHINGHEAGAIERGGHKVLALPARDGKITAKAIEACWNAWEQDETRDHVVMPEHLHFIAVVHHDIISKSGRPTHLGQVISGFKKGCNRRYWEMTGLKAEGYYTKEQQSNEQKRQGKPADASSPQEGTPSLRHAVHPHGQRPPSTGTTNRPPLFAYGYVDVITARPSSPMAMWMSCHSNPANSTHSAATSTTTHAAASCATVIPTSCIHNEAASTPPSNSQP